MFLKERFDLGKYFTFEASKKRPIYNWFYYKEAFSPEIVEFALSEEKINCGLILDPFCGIGTTLLAAKGHNLNAIGFDVSPLALLASKVKCADYSAEELEEIAGFLRITQNLTKPTLSWDFELFSPKVAFPRSNYNALLSLREKIAEVENEKVRNLLLLALVSVIPQVGIFIKDGGVLKIDKRKSAMPTKEAFRRKIKKMLFDLRHNSIHGPLPRVEQADSRRMPLENESIDLIITSPPYLNNVDYTKVYGLELSLLYLDKEITKKIRGKSLRSFITSNEPPSAVPEEIGEIGYKIPVIGNYFSDMEKVICEINRVLKKNSVCYLVIGNSVVYGTEIFVDELLAAIAIRHGMDAGIFVGAERLADVKPRKVKLRESILKFRKLE